MTIHALRTLLAHNYSAGALSGKPHLVAADRAFFGVRLNNTRAEAPLFRAAPMRSYAWREYGPAVGMRQMLATHPECGADRRLLDALESWAA